MKQLYWPAVFDLNGKDIHEFPPHVIHPARQPEEYLIQYPHAWETEYYPEIVRRMLDAVHKAPIIKNIHIYGRTGIADGM